MQPRQVQMKVGERSWILETACVTPTRNVVIPRTNAHPSHSWRRCTFRWGEGRGGRSSILRSASHEVAIQAAIVRNGKMFCNRQIGYREEHGDDFQCKFISLTNRFWLFEMFNQNVFVAPDVSWFTLIVLDWPLLGYKSQISDGPLPQAVHAVSVAVASREGLGCSCSTICRNLNACDICDQVQGLNSLR